MNRTQWRTGLARIACLTLLAAVLHACGGSEPVSGPPPAPPATSSSTQPSGASNTASGKMLVVDLDGKPLTGMAPVATLQPNAFDKPVSTGALTGSDGQSTIQFPADVNVFLRAWDPTLNYFPNNFYEVPPNQGGPVDDMRIEMVRSATLRAQILRPDGTPAANENVGLMMFHPTKGAWWPADADTDPNGLVEFSNVPPGAFVLKLKIASGAQIEIPETPIRPGGSADLGPVTLQ